MQRFTQLFIELDSSNRRTDKLAALADYFREAPAADAAWAVYFLSGNKVKRAVKTRLLREWVAARSGLPLWLVEESYEVVGDLAETLALLLPPASGTCTEPLHQLVRQRLLPLPGLDDSAKRALLTEAWREMDTTQRFLWNKLITGAFRVGVSQRLVVRALAQLTDQPVAVMAHRLAGTWEPTAENYQRLLSPDAEPEDDPAKPYPFYLASPLEAEPQELGPLADWQLEWKWDGIRAQLIKRRGQAVVWSRGEDIVSPQFPEFVEAAALLPDGTVLDGEALAWRDEAPLPFSELQQRLGRKKVGKTLRQRIPVAFMAYELLEEKGEDLRELPQAERRRRLDSLIDSLPTNTVFRTSPLLQPSGWEAAATLREQSRERLVEGLMIKRRTAVYQAGRRRGYWWKWKVAPYTLDAVLIYAQRGHGRRASLYTDYTFALWDGDQLVPIAKAYSGLTDDEIRQVDRFIRSHTRETFGPVRSVAPELVFELAFDDIRTSSRHKSGIALRFPRMSRWRQDKPAAEADSLETAQALLDRKPG